MCAGLFIPCRLSRLNTGSPAQGSRSFKSLQFLASIRSDKTRASRSCSKPCKALASQWDHTCRGSALLLSHSAPRTTRSASSIAHLVDFGATPGSSSDDARVHTSEKLQQLQLSHSGLAVPLKSHNVTSLVVSNWYTNYGAYWTPQFDNFSSLTALRKLCIGKAYELGGWAQFHR